MITDTVTAALDSAHSVAQSPELWKRIDALAAKLNVTAEHLWKVLCQQASVELLTSAIWLGIWLLLLVMGLVSLTLSVKALNRRVEPKPSDEEPFLAWVVISVIASIVFGIGTLANIYYTVQSIGYAMNPEYFALQQVMSLFK